LTPFVNGPDGGGKLAAIALSLSDILNAITKYALIAMLSFWAPHSSI